MLVELDTRRIRACAGPPRFLARVSRTRAPEIERIVERERAYVVVEKVGEKDKVADEADPRSDSG